MKHTAVDQTHVEGMANSVDPDQTAPIGGAVKSSSGSALFDMPVSPKNEPRHDKTSLIRVFAVHMKKDWVLSDPLSAQRRLWSFCCFCHVTAQIRSFTVCTVFRWERGSENVYTRCLLQTVPLFRQGRINCIIWHYVWEFCRPHTFYRIPLVDYYLNLSHVMRKPVLCHMRTTKIQISLHFCAVWSAPLLFAA